MMGRERGACKVGRAALLVAGRNELWSKSVVGQCHGTIVVVVVVAVGAVHNGTAECAATVGVAVASGARGHG